MRPSRMGYSPPELCCISLPDKDKTHVDLEEVILELAWQAFLEEEVQASCLCASSVARCARSHFELKVDWNTIKRTDVIKYNDEEEWDGRPETNDRADRRGVLPNKHLKTLTVFDTILKNDTGIDTAQKFAFNFNKEITDTRELSVTNSFTIGGSLNFCAAIEGADVGAPGMSINASWTGCWGDKLTESEKTSWSVNSEVILANNQSARIHAKVEQAKVERDITIESKFVVIASDGRIYVDVHHKKSKSHVTSVGFNAGKVAEEINKTQPNRVQWDEKNFREFSIETKAVLDCTCTARQDMTITKVEDVGASA